jgi:hypothetical protein
MKKRYGFVFGVMFLAGAATAFAKQNSVPFDKLTQEATVAVGTPSSDGKTGQAMVYSSSLSPFIAPSGDPGISLVRSTPPIHQPKVLNGKYFLLNGLHLGMAFLDVALTQRCIAADQCMEGNPMMSSSLPAQLGVDFVSVGYAAFMSYKLKKHHSTLWWLSPTTGIAAHTAGIITGLMR